MKGWRVKETTAFRLFVALAAALVFASVGEVSGGDRVNVRGMGMARTSAAVSRGLDAVGINPANLALADDAVMTITVLPVGAYLASDFFTYELYSKYFKDSPPLLELPDADKQIILDSFQSPLGSSIGEATARLFGITLRVGPTSTVAFTVDYGLVGAAIVPREYARLLLYGNVAGSAFDIDGLAFKAYWARSYTLSYGELLPKPAFLKWLSGGVGVKLVQGYGYYEIERGTASLRTASDGRLSGSVTWQARWTNANSVSDPMHNLFQDPAGYGLGFDIGISGGVDDYISFGISLTDIGWVEWSRDVEKLSSDSIVTTNDPDVFKNVRSLVSSAGVQKKKGQAFTSYLPGMLRFGISAQINKIAEREEFPGELLIAAEYLQGVGADSPLGEQPRLSFGLEYRPIQWLPIRTGFSVGGSSSSHVSFGLGFNFRWFDFDVATEDVFWLFSGQNFSTGSVGLGMRFRIPG
jgi:hypothetical protein